MQISTQTQDKFLIASVSGKLDGITSAELEKAASAWLTPNQKVVFDFSKLEYISSAGLRVVLTVAKKLMAQNGALCLCGLSGIVADVISMAAFDKVIPVFKDVAEATKA